MARIPQPTSDAVLDTGDAEVLSEARRRLGFTPVNGMVMSHLPGLHRAVWELSRVIFFNEGAVSSELKYLAGHVASRAAGCSFSTVHTAQAAAASSGSVDRVKAVGDFATSNLFTDAERCALRIAAAAAVTPSEVTDADIDELRSYFDDRGVVELLAAVSFYGFANRWNDAIGSELESESAAFAARVEGT